MLCLTQCDMLSCVSDLIMRKICNVLSKTPLRSMTTDYIQLVSKHDRSVNMSLLYISFKTDHTFINATVKTNIHFTLLR